MFHNRFRAILTPIIFFVLPSAIVQADGQLGEPVSWIPVPGHPEHFWMSQKTNDSTLLLTANSAFFPKLGLKAEGQGDSPDIDNLNGAKSFATVTQWKSGLACEWGVYFACAGKVHVTADILNGRDFLLTLGDQQQVVDLTQPNTFAIDRPGKYSVVLTCADLQQRPEFRRLTLTGDAVTGAAVIRKRWRPAAAHTKFSSSAKPNQVRMWIMEMDAVPGPLGFYSPITTPFGYYGPTWKADGTVNSGFNFSLWSYGRKQKEPPIEQFSHLIAIGNPTATFGHFGHEGTGVKVRNWEPLIGQQGQRQAFGLRVEPGKIYDTYTSYFYSATDEQWRLFAAGRKYNKEKPLKSLWVGSFVEVPGPPHVQRTGAYARRMKYRGWVVDAQNKLFSLDVMSNGNVNRNSGYTHTDRGVTDDGWFYLETGGWTFQLPPNNGQGITLQRTSSDQPSYLRADKLQFLHTIPSEITVAKVERTATDAVLTFAVNRGGDAPSVTAYWGSTEALTFAERWEHNTVAENPKEGNNQITLHDVRKGSPLYVRLLLRNSVGQFWTKETFIEGR